MKFSTKSMKAAIFSAALASAAFFGGWGNFNGCDGSLNRCVFAQEAENGAGNQEKVEFAEAKGVAYYSSEILKDADDYQKSQCRVDILYPNKPGFATIVWFHGGGLTGGGKYVPSAFKR